MALGTLLRRMMRRAKVISRHKIMFEHYYEDHGCYPAASKLTSCGAPDDEIRPYLPKMMCDPQTHQPYAFTVDPGCSSTYRIYANLANVDDPDISKVGCALNCGPDGDETYNYGVASSGEQVGESFASEPSQSGLQRPTWIRLSQQVRARNGIYVLPTARFSLGTWNCTCGRACVVLMPGQHVGSDDGLSFIVIFSPIGPRH
jgi:hypothetical protein